jgi:hypothetical protein
LQANVAIDLNHFAKQLLDILYEDAKPGSANQDVRENGKKIMEDVNRLIRAKLLDPSSAMRQTPLILTKEDTQKYLGIMDLIHTRYTQAHKTFVGDSDNPVGAQLFSYTMLWHIGNLIRSGTLATTVSPWVTGEQPPRF